MRNKFINQVFYKIIEGKYDPISSAAGAVSTLKRVEDVAEKIQASFGKEAVQNVLSYKEVKHALNQCIDYIQNLNTKVTDVDHTIYYDFIHAKLEKAEKIIDEDEDLKELDL